MSTDRSIKLEIEVPGTPEQVWQAIATGPGITSWYVPHTVEEKEGGATTSLFGPGMEFPGRAAVWSPPSRVLFDGGETGVGLAFEWLIDATDKGTCIVRLVNSGFGSGEEWDDQYDAMTEGWGIFLCNLRIHLEQFGGEFAAASIPTAYWAGPRDEAWGRLVAALEIDPDCKPGDSLELPSPDGSSPKWSARLVERTPHRLSFVFDDSARESARGSGLLAVEGGGEKVSVSAWAYFYGADAAATAAGHTSAWNTLLGKLGNPS